MTQLLAENQKDIWSNQHLEFDFTRNSLISTCETQNTLLSQRQSFTWKLPNSKIDIQKKQPDQKLKKLTTSRTDTSINKKSRCFITEVNKLLSKNKINTELTSRNDGFWSKSYLNLHGKKNKIHYKSQGSTQRTTKNEQKEKQSQNCKGKISEQNLNEILSKNFNTEKRKSALKKNDFQNSIDRSISIGVNLKKKPYFNDFGNESRPVNKSENELVKVEQPTQNSDQTKNSTDQKITQKSRFDKFIEDLQKLEIPKLLKTEKPTMKLQRKLTFKEIKRKQTIKANTQEIIQLKRSLQRAPLNVTLLSQKKSKVNSEKNVGERTERISAPLQKHKQFLSNEHKTIEEIHYGKLKDHLKEKLRLLHQTNQFIKAEQKQLESNNQHEIFFTEPQLVIISQACNMSVRTNDKISQRLDRKSEKFRRPNTAITRTGLQYTLGQSHRRTSSEKINRLLYLTAINNANHYGSSLINENRQIEEDDECKSNKVVRKLKQKYSSTPRFINSTIISPKSSRHVSPIKSRTCRNSEKLTLQSTRITYQKVTNKQIQKEKIKQKLFQIMIDCDEQRINNQNLTKGLNVFEDFCDDVDQGLKNISTEISQYIQKY